MRKQVVCKSCGYVFTLTKSEIQFYESKGYNIPKRCASCREKNRQEKADPYYGIYEAIANYTPLKKRRQRVHYAPYIVGGLR